MRPAAFALTCILTITASPAERTAEASEIGDATQLPATEQSPFASERAGSEPQLGVSGFKSLGCALLRLAKFFTSNPSHLTKPTRGSTRMAPPHPNHGIGVAIACGLCR
jgi:hypothetical protein